MKKESVKRSAQSNKLRRTRSEALQSRQASGQRVGQDSGETPERRRMMGAATKDNRHGVHTDHTTTRRSESRRTGSMGSESQSKSRRKNI